MMLFLGGGRIGTEKGGGKRSSAAGRKISLSLSILFLRFSKIKWLQYLQRNLLLCHQDMATIPVETNCNEFVNSSISISPPLLRYNSCAVCVLHSPSWRCGSLLRRSFDFCLGTSFFLVIFLAQLLLLHLERASRKERKRRKKKEGKKEEEEEKGRKEAADEGSLACWIERDFNNRCHCHCDLLLHGYKAGRSVCVCAWFHRHELCRLQTVAILSFLVCYK